MKNDCVGNQNLEKFNDMSKIHLAKHGHNRGYGALPFLHLSQGSLSHTTLRPLLTQWLAIRLSGSPAIPGK